MDRRIFARVRLWILDILFPILCIGCKKGNDWLCELCLKKIKLNNNFYCPLCGHFSFQGSVCFRCIKKAYLNGAWMATLYNDPLLKDAIFCFKYREIKDFFHPLGRLMLEFLQNHKIEKKFDMILSVPLHRRKMLMRGFNQSEFLSEKISPYFNCPIEKGILIRKRFTFSQSKMKYDEREDNIRGAFKVIDAKKICDKKILLVDDVITSGFTMNECAKVLKNGGALEVWGFALAKG